MTPIIGLGTLAWIAFVWWLCDLGTKWYREWRSDVWQRKWDAEQRKQGKPTDAELKSLKSSIASEDWEADYSSDELHELAMARWRSKVRSGRRLQSTRTG